MIRELQGGGASFKVLFISGYADAELGADGVIDEHIMFLQKPFAADTLARKVRDALDA